MNHIQTICLGAGVSQILVFMATGAMLGNEHHYISAGLVGICSIFLIWFYRSRDSFEPMNGFYMGVAFSALPVVWISRIDAYDPIGAYSSIIIIYLILVGITSKGGRE